MRQAYRVVAGLIAIGVLVQAAAIAMGWFMVIAESEDADVVLNADYEGNIGHALHGIVGLTIMPVLGLLLLIFSFFAKFPGAVKWAGFTFLAIVVQVALAFISFGVGELGFLHGLNAFVILGLAATAARRATVTDGVRGTDRTATASV